MSDPTRLTEAGAGEATALEQELLRAGKDARLPAHSKQEIWAGLSLQLVPPVLPTEPAAAAGGAVKAAVATKTLGAAAALKGTLLAVALSGGGLAGYRAMTAAPARPTALTAPAPRAEAPEPLAPEPPAPAPRVATARTAAPARRHDDVPARAAPTSHLAAEARVVIEARQELRDGRVAEALRALEAARATFADGALVQEREALTIEALAREGRREAAGQRAAAFLRAYPGSPHAAAVKSFAAP